jgi:hypothetical protein
MALQTSNTKSDSWHRWARLHPRTASCLARHTRIITSIILGRTKTDLIPLKMTNLVNYHLYNHKNTISYHQVSNTRFDSPYGSAKTKRTPHSRLEHIIHQINSSEPLSRPFFPDSKITCLANYLDVIMTATNTHSLYRNDSVLGFYTIEYINTTPFT